MQDTLGQGGVGIVHLAVQRTPQRLRRLVEAGMAAEPSARPATAEAVRLALQAFREEADPTVGQRARIFVVSVVAAAVLGRVVWARDSLGRTQLNRNVAAALVVVQLISLLSDIGFTLAEVDPDRIFAFNLLVYAAISAMTSTSITRLFAIPAVACAVAFVGSALHPGWVFPLTAAANASVVVTARGLWLPAARATLFDRPEGRR